MVYNYAYRYGHTKNRLDHGLVIACTVFMVMIGIAQVRPTLVSAPRLTSGRSTVRIPAIGSTQLNARRRRRHDGHALWRAVCRVQHYQRPLVRCSFPWKAEADRLQRHLASWQRLHRALATSRVIMLTSAQNVICQAFFLKRAWLLYNKRTPLLVILAFLITFGFGAGLGACARVAQDAVDRLQALQSVWRPACVGPCSEGAPHLAQMSSGKNALEVVEHVRIVADINFIVRARGIARVLLTSRRPRPSSTFP
jgi:hypothetical protein